MSAGQRAWVAATLWLAAAVALVAFAACTRAPPAAGPTLRLWHTFGPGETRALNASLAQFESAARALTGAGRFGLSLRSDGYWFVAWLRAAGADVVDPASGALGVDRPEAEAALARYAALAAPGGGGVAPPPAPAGD